MTENTALLLLDLQNEMVDPAGKVGAGGLAKVVSDRKVVENAATALGVARQKALPVAHIRLGFRPDYSDALSVAPRIAKLKASGGAVLGTWGTEFPEKIAPQQSEIIFTKQCVNPFYNTGLMNWLFKKNVTRIVIGGVVTNLVVEMTARAADDAGFAVTVLEDICAAPNLEWHAFSTQNIIPLFGEVISTEEFVRRS